MKPNLEQLTMLSDYELNCAIAEKKGYVVKERYKDTGIIILDIIHEGKHLVRPVDYCNVPNDWWPIAAEHSIKIRTKRKENIGMPFVRAPGGRFVYADNNDVLPRAVCIAFLLMELDK